MDVAERALPRGPINTGVRLVLIDVAYHPGSSIGEITERTGFPQSHVSQSVAKLRELGVLETTVDPVDRRRTLVRPTPVLQQRAARASAATPLQEVLACALGEAGRGQLGEAVAAIELLASLFIPEALRGPPRPGEVSALVVSDH